MHENLSCVKRLDRYFGWQLSWMLVHIRGEKCLEE